MNAASAAAAGLALLALALAEQGHAQRVPAAGGKSEQEIAPFRLTGVEGYVQMRSLVDATSHTAEDSGANSRARQSILATEAFVLTHGYVYHPSFMTLDIGGGPVLERIGDRSNDVATSGRRTMYNATAHATFLRDKPYTADLFYDRNNRTQSMGPALEVLTQSTRSGFDLALRSPVTPRPVRLEVTRTTNRADSPEQRIDDRVGQVRLSTDAAIGSLGTTAFQYLDSRQRSSSGSAALPIQESTLDHRRASADTRLRFGLPATYELTNVVVVDRSDYRTGEGALTHLSTDDFVLDLRGRHSDDLQTTARYNYDNSHRADESLRLHAASAGLTYRFTPQVTGSLNARGQVDRGSQLDSTLYAVDGSALYQRPLFAGQVALGYTMSYSRRDQQTNSAEAKVLGEHQTLSGTNFAILSKQQAVPASIVVSNLSRSQVFVEGVDYLVSQLGLTVRLQRLVGGSILDGQELLIDYAYLLGGTYAATQLDQTVSVGWTYRNFLNLYGRAFDAAPHLQSGTPTTPLNPVRSTVYGLRSDVPLMSEFPALLVGGTGERERRHELILPYSRASYEAYSQVDLPLVAVGNLRVGARRVQIDYDNNPLQAVRLAGRDLRIWTRTESGLELSLDATRERDTGTPQVRERSYTAAKAQWRRRKLSWTFALTHTVDVQALTRRSRTYGQMVLRRDL